MSTPGTIWFLRRDEKVRVCSSSSVEGGGVQGGEAAAGVGDGLKHWLDSDGLAKLSVEVSNWKPRFSRAWMTCALDL